MYTYRKQGFVAYNLLESCKALRTYKILKTNIWHLTENVRYTSFNVTIVIIKNICELWFSLENK